MSEWQIDPRLQRDSIELGNSGLIQIRAMPAAPWPWLILVPRHPGAVELFDLPDALRREFLDLGVTLARQMKAVFSADKINVGAIGNVVAQLHLHIIARHRGDPAWPAPVWGFAYEPTGAVAQTHRLERLRELVTGC